MGGPPQTPTGENGTDIFPGPGEVAAARPEQSEEVPLGVRGGRWGRRRAILTRTLARRPLSLRLRLRQLPRGGEPVRGFDGPVRLPPKTPSGENGTDIFPGTGEVPEPWARVWECALSVAKKCPRGETTVCPWGAMGSSQSYLDQNARPTTPLFIEIP